MSGGPHPALQRLNPLIGTWDLTGRTLGAKRDDIKGRVLIRWMPGGFFQEQRGEIEIPEAGLKVESVEILGYDPQTDTFPSTTFNSLSATPGSYAWDVRGKIVTHWTKGAKYTGTLSDDGKTLTGGWRSDDGSTSPGSSYDAVMTRVS